MTSRDPPSEPSGTIRVLYVEDNDQTGPLVREWLERHDSRFDVSVAFSLDDAGERLSEESFDAVVADYRFPNGTGLELVGDARDVDPGMPFLLYSALVDDEVRREADAAGVTAVVEKGDATQLSRLAEHVLTDLRDRPAEPEGTEATEDHLTAFAAEVTHDLRTPLSVAQGRLDLLDPDGESAERLREALDDIERVVDSLPERAREFDPDD
ncbi:response regulator [Halorarius halobius]|uniref:response regulator n=1 Tax=Halorarius halobius TaxID=2962671 RepID=UPI0020CDFDC3|nr:response regulator [Halorarius halobius]